MPVHAVLFDLDGTLADSFAAIAASVNHVRGLYALPPVPQEAVNRAVGFGLADLMNSLLPGIPPADAVAAYQAHHPGVMLAGTRLFPGVIDALAILHARGVPMAVCSNKAVRFTKQLVLALGLGEFFPVVLGPEDVSAPKPDPAMLLEGCRRLKVSPADAVYVGDMTVDIHAARAAGMPVWIVDWGLGIGAPEIGTPEPDRVLAGFGELSGLVG